MPNVVRNIAWQIVGSRAGHELVRLLTSCLSTKSPFIPVVEASRRIIRARSWGLTSAGILGSLTPLGFAEDCFTKIHLDWVDLGIVASRPWVPVSVGWLVSCHDTIVRSTMRLELLQIVTGWTRTYNH